eukprot:sb/3465159/
MFLLALWTLLFLTVHSDSSLYYVILRLPNDPQQYSAQFKQIQLTDTPVPWSCQSGNNPITYIDNALPITARSIDIEEGRDATCLGVVVRVVRATQYWLWRGEDGQCPGFMTSTTSLRQTDSLTRVEMMIKPLTEFQVYTTPPSEECASRQPTHLNPPTVSFSRNGSIPVSCAVVTERPDLLSCNISILAGTTNEAIAVATRAKTILVPQFVKKSRLRSVTCQYTCRIREDLESSGTVVGDMVEFNLSSPPDLPSPSTPELTQRSSTTAVRDTQWLVILLYILAVLLLISIITTAVLCHISRALRRRLRHHTRYTKPPPPPLEPVALRKQHQQMQWGNTAPAGYNLSHYSTLNDTYNRTGCNQCTHYNTVSLRLSESFQGGEGGDDGRAIYQKLDLFNRDNNEPSNDSQATSV